MRFAKVAALAVLLSSLAIPMAAHAAPESYRVVHDEVYDDASLYQILNEKYQTASTAKNAEQGVALNEIILQFPNRTEHIIRRGDCMEEIVEFYDNKKSGELAKVCQVAYATGENYISSYYIP